MLQYLESPWSVQDTKTEAEMWAVVPNVRITRKNYSIGKAKAQVFSRFGRYRPVGSMSEGRSLLGQ